MNPKNDDETGSTARRGFLAEWEYRHSALAALAARPRKEVVSAHHSMGGVKLQLHPVQFLVLTVRRPTGFEGPALRLKLDAVFAHLNGEMKQKKAEGFRIEEEASGEQPDGTYRLTLSTILNDDLPTVANMVAALTAQAVGKDTVRVQVMSANQTLYDIAA